MSVWKARRAENRATTRDKVSLAFEVKLQGTTRRVELAFRAKPIRVNTKGFISSEHQTISKRLCVQGPGPRRVSTEVSQPQRRTSARFFAANRSRSLRGALFCPFAEILTYPFRLFVTFIHEGGHAIAALLTGNSVESLSIATNASGETYTSRGGVFSQVFVASAGYL